MAIPLLSYAPSSQNHRVDGFEIPGDEQIQILSTKGDPTEADLDQIIWAAYRQVFNEQQILISNRQPVLESQLRNKVITVREFIRGLAVSETFRLRNLDSNNNYRFVELCIQRILGRKAYHQREVIAWSIVLGTKGLAGLIDALQDSEEYQQIFGDHTVPYQRRRILPQRAQGEAPFARTPRYNDYYLKQLQELGYFRAAPGAAYRWSWQQPPYPKAYQYITVGTLISGSLFVGLGLLATLLAYYGLISL